MTNKTAQFTPGPYELRGSRLLTDSNGVVLADNIGANWPGTIEGQANLFAAAPAMYEALVETMRVLRSLRDSKEEWYTMVTPELLNVWDRNKQALAQAEGR